MKLGLKEVAFLTALSAVPMTGCKSQAELDAVTSCEATAPDSEKCDDLSYRRCEELAQLMHGLMSAAVDPDREDVEAHVPDKAMKMMRVKCLAEVAARGKEK